MPIADWLGQAAAIHLPGFGTKAKELIIIVIAAMLLHILGLIDDKKHLSPAVKLLAQFAIAISVAAFANVRVELFIHNTIITSLLSGFWIVLIINAFNFLDNMDGLSTGIAFVCVSILGVIAALNGQVFVSASAIVFAGTLAGFLVFNFAPASIFMGDAGSFIVGFFVAILTLRTTYYHQAQSPGSYAVLMPLIIMALPLYDFLSVTIIRILQGKSPFIGDTQHFSHRLTKRGLSITQAVLTLYLATLCTGLGAIILRQVNPIAAIIVFAQTIMILLIVAILEMTGKNDRH